MNLLKRVLYFLLLLPSLLFGQKYQVYTGEYNTYVRHPATKLLYDITGAGLNPGSVTPLAGSPVIADEDQAGQLRKGSAALHHAAFIDKDGNVWTRGDGTGYRLVKTPVTNAAQVIAYANSGDGSGPGLGQGIATLTNDGKIILQGNTQSGFRGDGTEGNQTESAPYTVTGIPAIKKIQAGSYFFALGNDGVVYHWGGTRRDPYWSQFSCGAFTGIPNLTKPASMNLPEPIIDIEAGADWSYAVGQSGQKYAWGYDGHYWGNAAASQQIKYFNLSSLLTMPGKMVQLAIGTQASYGLMDNGDIWAWGDNTQAQIGNGKEATFANFVAPWNGGSLWQLTPVKINPAGVAFVKIFTGIGDAFYVYAEDTTGNLWVWGRNKGFVLWNGVGGTSTQQDKQPNMWDVLAPMKIAGFGALIVTPPPPPVNKPPTAVISSVTSLTWPANGLQLDGSASFDTDGSIVSYRWSSTNGMLSDTAAKRPIVLFSSPGSYYVTLTVTDNNGATSVSLIAATVNPPIVCPQLPAPRTATGVIVHINGIGYTMPVSWLTISYSDGTTQ